MQKQQSINTVTTQLGAPLIHSPTKTIFPFTASYKTVAFDVYDEYRDVPAANLKDADALAAVINA